MNKIENWLALLRAPGMKPDQFHLLLNVFGSPDKVLGASHDSLLRLGLKTECAAAIQDPPAGAIQADLEWSQHQHHHIISFHDARYPELLKAIPAPPPVLFVRGDPDFLQLPQLAMVGSRTPTASGRRTAMEFARHLSRAGINITSAH